jgi:hypothetical protein
VLSPLVPTGIWENFFVGDSVENGFIRGKAVENRVFDGNIRALWGELGKNGGTLGVNGGGRSGVPFTI